MSALIDRYGHLSGRDLIAAMVTEAFRGRIAVTSSFGAESAVLLDLVAQVDPSVPVIFLDTGTLFDETLSYRYRLQRRLGLTDVRVARPTDQDRADAEGLWETDHDRCCHLRKVLPMARAIHGFDALIDGRKRAHGGGREGLGRIEDVGGLVKIAPLADWTDEMIGRAFRERDLPRHPLLDQGYRSVGCWPCTRPVDPDQPVRSGRWAGTGKTECGIHTKPLVFGRDGAGI